MTRESGWYPPGAEFDSRAPWNQPDDCEVCDNGEKLEVPKCPECGRKQPREDDGPDPDHEYESARDERAMRDLEDD